MSSSRAIYYQPYRVIHYRNAYCHLYVIIRRLFFVLLKLLKVAIILHTFLQISIIVSLLALTLSFSLCLINAFLLFSVNLSAQRLFLFNRYLVLCNISEIFPFPTEFKLRKLLRYGILDFVH